MKRLLLAATAALALIAASPALAQGHGSSGGATSGGSSGSHSGSHGTSSGHGGSHGGSHGSYGEHGTYGTHWGHGHNNAYNSYHRYYHSGHRYHGSYYNRPHGWYSHNWSYGEYLPLMFWASQYWINNWHNYDLMAPPPGCVWVRYGNDALLIDEDTGEIIQVVRGLYY